MKVSSPRIYLLVVSLNIMKRQIQREKERNRLVITN